jgi:hypothetical protein
MILLITAITAVFNHANNLRHDNSFITKRLQLKLVNGNPKKKSE